MIRIYDNQSYLFPLDVRRVETNAKKVALTFDGGGKFSFTKDILESLALYDIVASYFLTGRFIKHFPDDVRLIVEAGHEIGNHTLSHPRLVDPESRTTSDGVTRDYLAQELSRVEERLRECGLKFPTNIWRAPYGLLNREVLLWAQELGYRHVNWSIDTTDWLVDQTHPEAWSGSRIAQGLIDLCDEAYALLPGGIVLMHLGANYEGDPLYKHLGRIIDHYLGAGFQFVPCGELLRDINV